MDITPKCKRAMTKDEVANLIDLIQINPIITSKEINATTNKQKDEAWDSLTAAFNAKSGSISRQKEQLKIKWDNLKKTARKRSQQIKMNHLKTGGGKAEFIPSDEILERVTGLLGSTSTGFEVPNGGDGALGGGDSDMVLDLEVLKVSGDATESQKPVAPDIARPRFNEILLRSTSGAKKRKVDTNNLESPEEISGAKFLCEMSSMSQSLQKEGVIITDKDNGRLKRNLAIANYYEKMAEKVDLEIRLLKTLVDKENNGYSSNK